MKTFESILLGWPGKALSTAVLSWATWMTITVLRHDNQIAVLRYKAFQVSDVPAPSGLLPPADRTLFAQPLLLPAPANPKPKASHETERRPR